MCLSHLFFVPGSRGVTPTDALDTISETPREKMTPRMQRGQRSEQSPRFVHHIFEFKKDCGSSSYDVWTKLY